MIVLERDKRRNVGEHMTRPWKGDVWVGAGAAYFVGNARDNDLHAHYVLQLCVALGEPFNVLEDAGRTRRARGILIPSGKRHCVRNASDACAETLMMFIEPDSQMGRLLAAQYPLDQGEIIDIDEVRLTAVKARLSNAAPGGGEPLVRELINVLTDGAWRHRGVDRRVAFALDYIAHHLCESNSLEHVAQHLSLTPRYLRKLFEHEIGLSPQRYRQWCKLRAALTGVLDGDSFTDAAATAGFTDSAHFSRTFRDMFGSPPSAIFESSARRASLPVHAVSTAATGNAEHLVPLVARCWT